MESIGIRTRIIEDIKKFPQKVLVEALHKAIPVEAIDSALKSTGSVEKRKRRLPARLVVIFIIAMNIWTEAGQLDVFRYLISGLKWCSALLLAQKLPAKSALSQARSRLGVLPMKEIFHSVCRPIATPITRGAYYKGLRVVGIDGSTFDIQDTPENEERFGRPGSHRKEGGGAFPQAKVVALVECGTHATIDIEPMHYRTGEQVGARKLLHSVKEGMLLTWDRNFHGYEMHRRVRRTKAHLLGRIKKNLIFPVLERLSDGSYLSVLRPSANSKKRKKSLKKRSGKNKRGVRVRIIEYTFDDPNRPGHGEKHRLITSLLDPVLYPAQELIVEYHERWEEELVFDQIKVHQRRKSTPLRSLTPDGVLQEIYGLFLAHYAVRSLMHKAALATDQDPDRLSFVSTLRIIQIWIPRLQQACTEALPFLYHNMLLEIGRTTNPPREDRTNPRVVKRKMSNFLRKHPHHRRPPRPLKTFAESLVLLK